ncbi:hypothetical protein [Streptomyces canus]|uniref:hypothetical protein n=1 Tax=Streptomyces canus TaxID=58343 RepID=UPI000746A3C7|nr:hypothetical protein [Streptomyces canus]KUN00655.1 hypothetical protein AQI96_41735 [Streptomyces canus]
MESLIEDLVGMTVVVAVQRFVVLAPHRLVAHAVDVDVPVDGRGKAARIVRVQLPDRLGGVVDVLDGSGGVLGEALADGLGRVLGDRALTLWAIDLAPILPAAPPPPMKLVAKAPMAWLRSVLQPSPTRPLTSSVGWLAVCIRPRATPVRLVV